MSDTDPLEEASEERREKDRVERVETRLNTLPLGSSEEGTTVRVHVVSWVNNTFWRTAVAMAFAASLFSIYDNGQRVDRLEGQVCESLAVSRINLDTLEYYKEHPDEREAARRNVEKDLQRFHCPDPDSPVATRLSGTFTDVSNGVAGFGKPILEARPR